MPSGPPEFGWISHAFLGIALRRAEFETGDRRVERPDILAYRGTKRYALEAKAAEGDAVSITKRDLDGVVEFALTGVAPIVAALCVELESKWIFARADRRRLGRIPKSTLMAWSVAGVTDEVNSYFAEVLAEHFDLALGRGSEGLRTRLPEQVRQARRAEI